MALEHFLAAQHVHDPAGLGDLSLRVVRMLGSGACVAAAPGAPELGHFGLAVSSGAHSTAPNRRCPGLVTQRLVKACLAGAAPPCSHADLVDLARHCTVQEDNANKVERSVLKAAAALLPDGRVGERFAAMVTGVPGAATMRMA